MSDSRLNGAFARHGGLALWHRIEHVDVRFEELGAPLMWMKGVGRTFPRPGIVRLLPHRYRVEFFDYPVAGSTGIFDHGRVWVGNMAAAPEMDRLPRYRDTFRGWAKYRRWKPADAVYFFGYALSNYLGIPFLLDRELEVTSCRSVGPRSDYPLRVTARFPSGRDSHSTCESFYFDETGLLYRHDYTAEIVGWWAIGSHFTSEYRALSGLPIATRRQVYVRLFGLATRIPVLRARVEPLEVRLRPG